MQERGERCISVERQRKGERNTKLSSLPLSKCPIESRTREETELWKEKKKTEEKRVGKRQYERWKESQRDRESERKVSVYENCL